MHVAAQDRKFDGCPIATDIKWMIIVAETKSKFLRWTLSGQGSEVYEIHRFSCIILWQIDRFGVLYCLVNNINMSIISAVNNCKDSSIDRVDIGQERSLANNLQLHLIIYPSPYNDALIDSIFSQIGIHFLAIRMRHFLQLTALLFSTGSPIVVYV